MRRPSNHVAIRVADRSVRFSVAGATALALTLVGVAALAVAGLMVGDYDIAVGEVLAAVTGRSQDPLVSYLVTDLRGPRIVTAVAVGAALGVSGSLFQNVTANVLGSPDIIGFTTGAATGALVQIIVMGGDNLSVAVGALVGGLTTAAVVQLLVRPQALTGQRLVLVGIGVGAALAAVNTLLVVRASLVAAQTASQWLAGSLNAALWPRALAVCVSVAVLAAVAIALSRPLGMLVLGDDVAQAGGIDVRRLRTASMLVGVGLVSVATAATGPIAFVALAAPQISRRLARSGTSGLVGSAATGALLVLASDLVARRLFAPTELAVGVVTGALGGVYLVVLLAGEWRRSYR